MKMGGYIGIGIGGVASVLAVQQVCNGGSAQACEEIKFIERGKFAGSTFEISKIAGMVLWSSAYIRVGDVSPVDLESFPPHLRRHLIINTTLMLTSCIWMIVVAILLKLR